MKVSIISPTYNREERLRNLYHHFVHQTYPHIELIVLDDSPAPSKYMQEIMKKDSRVLYERCAKQSLGEKRNQLISLAKGEVIAHFDDDDHYQPQYIEKMLSALISANSDFIKLSSWLSLRELDQTIWYWDCKKLEEKHFVVSGKQKEVRAISFKNLSFEKKENIFQANLWGFGFSYMYKKSVFPRCSYEAIDFGEDIEFFKSLKKNNFSCSYVDHPELVLHTLHTQNLSKVFPQKQLDSKKILSFFKII